MGELLALRVVRGHELGMKLKVGGEEHKLFICHTRKNMTSDVDVAAAI